MPDLRTNREERPLPVFETIDAYLLNAGWTIRGPENGREEVNYGDSVYVCPSGRMVGRAGGWIDALDWQALIELEQQER